MAEAVRARMREDVSTFALLQNSLGWAPFMPSPPLTPNLSYGRHHWETSGCPHSRSPPSGPLWGLCDNVLECAAGASEARRTCT